MSTISYLLTWTIALLLISYGLGTIVGRSSTTGEKVVKWEIKVVKEITRAILKTISGWLAKAFLKINKKL